MEIDYHCADCQHTFTISVTDDEVKTVLASTHTEKCPSCSQNVGRRQVAFRQCGELTILTYPYFGTNVLGMLWACIGLFPTSIAVATIEMPQILMAMLLLSGVVVSILLDVWWRARSQLVKGSGAK